MVSLKTPPPTGVRRRCSENTEHIFLGITSEATTALKRLEYVLQLHNLDSGHITTLAQSGPNQIMCSTALFGVHLLESYTRSWKHLWGYKVPAAPFRIFKFKQSPFSLFFGKYRDKIVGCTQHLIGTRTTACRYKDH